MSPRFRFARAVFAAILPASEAIRASVSFIHQREYRRAMKRLQVIVIVVAAGCPALRPARADIVTTTDGSRLMGTVQEIADDRLVMLTEFAGRLDIDLSSLTGLSTADAVNADRPQTE